MVLGHIANGGLGDSELQVSDRKGDLDPVVLSDQDVGGMKGGKTYRDMVLGEENVVMLDEEQKDEVEEGDVEGSDGGVIVEECQIGGYDCPAFRLSKYEEKRIQRPWRRGVIVKLLGRKIGYKALEARLRQMWVRRGMISIVDLGNDYYLVAFSHEDDKNVALSDGSWFIYDHYLTVKEWCPNFHSESDTIERVTVWLRIAGLPIEYYDPIILTTIGNRIGKTVKVDKTTSQVERGKYARICVEVDLSKPLLAMFTIKKKMYKIEYEGLHLICLVCGRFGHYKEGCSENKRVNNDSSEKGGNSSEATHGVGDLLQGGMGDGPWKVVQKQIRGKKLMGEKKNSSPAIINGRSGISGSRFNLLSQENPEVNVINPKGDIVAYEREVNNGINVDLEENSYKGGKRKEDCNEEPIIMHAIGHDDVHVKNRINGDNKGNHGKGKMLGDKERGKKVYNLATRGKVSFKGKNNGGRNGGENTRVDKAKFQKSNVVEQDSRNTVLIPQIVIADSVDKELGTMLGQSIIKAGHEHLGNEASLGGGSSTSRPPDKGIFGKNKFPSSGSKEIRSAILHIDVDNTNMQDGSEEIEEEIVVETLEVNMG
ncbi:uncharacterized protein LOC131619849 [Vicia villosa]|uniref:uncharacterized protein LOC131619849 n=1 Tax=Vicia villosa TaxID=3911 RepID=UPI00273CE300|nr:uncharacterized protein LOC131619849 [Vicia villosa]